jgi:hypothetical protein
MSSPSSVLTSFVLEHLHTQTVARRIEITRAAAAIIPTDAERRELLAIADTLERVERRQRRLTLRFKQSRAAKGKS